MGSELTEADRYPRFDFDTVDFVTSDTHFGHARISELAQRPFSTVEEMDAELIRRWNETVPPDAVVLHLGNLALGPIEGSVARTAQLHGRKYLVPGNHDRVSPATQTRKAVERFSPMYEYAGWTILPEILQGSRRGRSLLASHYPYEGDSQPIERHSTHRPDDHGLPLLHGHTHTHTHTHTHAHGHGAHGYQFHVGVDAFDYTPIPFSLVDGWMADAPWEHR